MSVDSSESSDEDKPIFRPLTRDSLAQIQARIDSENAKKKELERKRAEGEVSTSPLLSNNLSKIIESQHL